MKNLSTEQQIEVLRPTVKSGIARSFHHWLIAVAVALSILGIVLWHPVPFMIAAFFGIVGLSERQAGPNIEAAIKAYDTGTPTVGEVCITVDTSGDSDHYHALVREPGQPDWEYEFVPQGWQPAAGTHPARIWRVGRNAPPVLAAVERGILIPRYDPSLPQVCRDEFLAMMDAPENLPVEVGYPPISALQAALQPDPVRPQPKSRRS